MIYSQNGLVYSDTLYHYHGPYSEIGEAALVTHCILSEEDYKKVTSQDPFNTFDTDSIFSKYIQHNFYLLRHYNNRIHPYELFSFIIGRKRYNPTFPNTSYYVSRESIRKIELLENHREAQVWKLKKAYIYFYNKEFKLGQMKVFFPLQLEQIKKFIDKSDRFIIILQNEIYEKIKVEFHLEEQRKF